MTVPAGLSRLLRSSKLTLALLLLVAPLAAVGTVIPAGRLEAYLGQQGWPGLLTAARFLGIAGTFRSPVFLLLVTLFCLNVLLCTWHRARPALGSRERRARGALDAAMHLALVAMIAAGALKAAFGVIGMQYLFEGHEIRSIWVEARQAEVPLEFGLLLKQRAEDYYPLALRIGIRDRSSGREVGLFEVREGAGVRLPGGEMSLALQAHDPAGRRVRLRAATAAATADLDFDLFPGGRISAAFERWEIVIVAWRRDLMRVRGLVQVIDGGRVVKEQWLLPNGRVAHRGWSAYLTAWGADRYQNQYLGIQASRDPAAALFWAGAVLLCGALPAFLVVRRRPGRDGVAGTP